MSGREVLGGGVEHTHTHARTHTLTHYTTHTDTASNTVGTETALLFLEADQTHWFFSHSLKDGAKSVFPHFLRSDRTKNVCFIFG